MSQTKAELVNGLNINAAAADAVTVNSAGRVGINTSSPATLLNINVDTEANLGNGSEGIRLTSGSSNAQFVRLGDSYSNNSVTGPGTLLFSSNKLSLRCDNGNPITFHTGSTVAERMRISSDGKVGINIAGSDNTSPVRNLDIADSSGAILRLISSDDSLSAGDRVGAIEFFTDDDDSPHVSSFISAVADPSDSFGRRGALRFGTRSDSGDASERMRLDHIGNILHAVTSWTTSSGGLKIAISSGVTQLNFSRPSSYTGSQNVILNYHNGTYIGGINTSTSATSFLTSSDYRLKENAVAISDGITRLKTLKPYRFNWKVDSSTKVDGFFAHEVTPVVPEAITGTKDETQDILYTEEDTIPSGKKVGDIKETVPKYQGIDQSKLVPLLVAAVQELITKVETLEAA